MSNQTIRFKSDQKEFISTLNRRVNQYFKDTRISRYGNANMWLKTLVMYALCFGPFALILTQVITQPWLALLACIVMGVGVAGIGLAVMHDANHGSYSSKSWINNMMGYSLNLIGGCAFNWKVQHNVLHHTYTNVFEVDEDISPRGVLRMSPDSPYKKMHKYQHLYAWFFYGLLTFVWVIIKDYGRLKRYHDEGLIQKMNSSPAKEWTILALTKVVYCGVMLVLPTLLLPFAFWQVFLGFFVMHYVSGFILAVVFQPAHVVDGTEYIMPDSENNLENSWAVHQLKTTTNFAQNNRILSWYVGGLNYQVEHHLFPNICHIHYRKIAPIVSSTAKEFGLPYKSKKTFRDALKAHAKMLKELGEGPIEKQIKTVVLSEKLSKIA